MRERFVDMATDKKFSQVPVKTALALTDRVVILSDPGLNPSGETATLADLQIIMQSSWVAPVVADTYVSGQVALPALGTTAAPLAHGLGSTPYFVRVVLVCVVNDAATGYLTTDGEIEMVSATAADGSEGRHIFSVSADATNITLLRNSAGTGSGKVQLRDKATGVPTTVTADANWEFKVYARL